MFQPEIPNFTNGKSNLGGVQALFTLQQSIRPDGVRWRVPPALTIIMTGSRAQSSLLMSTAKVSSNQKNNRGDYSKIFIFFSLFFLNFNCRQFLLSAGRLGILLSSSKGSPTGSQDLLRSNPYCFVYIEIWLFHQDIQ